MLHSLGIGQCPQLTFQHFHNFVLWVIRAPAYVPTACMHAY
uniref:Uncharacterized protein n=1 Tax=Rhizophora mucronata TaxID=61149 RepID=A0A2P2IRQ9_RHIMU